MKRHVHFVGFRGEEFWSAVKVWGQPDFIHLINDHRSEGDIDEDDLVIFGPKAGPVKSQFSWQDHELW